MITDETLAPPADPDQSSFRRVTLWLLVTAASVVALVLLFVWGADTLASEPSGGCGGG